MSIMAGRKAVNRQPWHWRSSREFASRSASWRQREKRVLVWVLETWKPTSSEMPPPTRVHFWIFPKIVPKLETKHSNLRANGDHSHSNQHRKQAEHKPGSGIPLWSWFQPPAWSSCLSFSWKQTVTRKSNQSFSERVAFSHGVHRGNRKQKRTGLLEHLYWPSQLGLPVLLYPLKMYSQILGVSLSGNKEFSPTSTEYFCLLQSCALPSRSKPNPSSNLKTILLEAPQSP